MACDFWGMLAVDFAQLFLAQEWVKDVRAVLNGTEKKANSNELIVVSIAPSANSPTPVDILISF